jgi:ubiquinone/menaquinone biosynthesis C-methylase UbiE
VTSRERFYDTIADDFDALMNPYDLERRIEIVFDQLLAGRSLTNLRVLDVGCGTGPFSLAAQARRASVTSLDIGVDLLRRARSKGAARVLAGDATSLPFANSTFDLVISSECIEHTVDPERSVTEMLRVLRSNGTLVLSCPNRVWRWSAVTASALKIRPYQGLENWPGWWALEQWVRASGGDVTDHRGFHLFPFVLAVTWPLLRWTDRFGTTLGAVFVNQAIVAVKR